MQMHISFLQPESMLVWIIYELLHSLNFGHGLMVHINAYFACFMNKHHIFEDLYLYCIIQDMNKFVKLKRF
jgi:branched-subunit amino acid ABC-type transport system permease component